MTKMSCIDGYMYYEKKYRSSKMFPLEVEPTMIDPYIDTVTSPVCMSSPIEDTHIERVT